MTRPRRSKKNYNRWMKLVRRAHLYAGLILLPWVLFFGVSGFLLNHNTALFGGRTQVEKQLSPTSSEPLSHYQSIDAQSVAAQILEQINAQSATTSYQLQGSNASVAGALSYTAHTQAGEVTVKIDLESGDTEISKNAQQSVAQSKSAFEGKRVKLENFDTDTTETLATKLLEAEGYEIEEALELKTRGAPELRFQVVDTDGRAWKTTYNFASGKLSARATDEASGFNLHAALTRLHKSHDYPDQVNARWFWTLFADITALTLIFWGVSGGIMWWQMKPTRLIGISGLSFAAVLAALIFGGTLNHLTWGRVREQAPQATGPASPSSERRGERAAPKTLTIEKNSANQTKQK